jgi:hypothetical protein
MPKQKQQTNDEGSNAAEALAVARSGPPSFRFNQCTQLALGISAPRPRCRSPERGTEISNFNVYTCWCQWSGTGMKSEMVESDRILGMADVTVL